LGIIFPNLELLPKCTVEENLLLPLQINNFPSKRAKKAVELFLHLTNLSEKKNILLSALSSGEQRQLAMARALINEPEIVLADEPTANLGPKITAEIFHPLLQANQQGATLIIFTGNEKLLKQYPRRTLTIQDGKVF